MTKEQAPTSAFFTLQTGLCNRTCHWVTLDEVLALAGWSKSAVRRLKGKASVLGSSYDKLVCGRREEFLLDYINKPTDVYAIRLGGYSISFQARPETWLDKVRHFIVRLPVLRRLGLEFLLPPIGKLAPTSFGR